MPVFRAMTPQVQEQYPGGGGGGYPQPLLGGAPPMPQGGQGGIGAEGQAIGGAPYQGGLAPGAGGQTAAGAFSPLDNAREAVWRSLVARGINPDFQTHGVRQLLAKADDIVRGLVGRAAAAGQQDIITGGGLQDALNSIIGGAASGTGTVLSGPAEGRAGLQAINNLINGVRSGGGGASEGSQLLTQLFGGDPANAVPLMESLLYGGLAPSVRGAFRPLLANRLYEYNQGIESPQGGAADINRSALDILLSGLFHQGGGAPIGAAGLGSGPGTGAPAMPAPGAGAPAPYSYQGPPGQPAQQAPFQRLPGY